MLVIQPKDKISALLLALYDELEEQVSDTSKRQNRGDACSPR